MKKTTSFILLLAFVKLSFAAISPIEIILSRGQHRVFLYQNGTFEYKGYPDVITRSGTWTKNEQDFELTFLDATPADSLYWWYGRNKVKIGNLKSNSLYSVVEPSYKNSDNPNWFIVQQKKEDGFLHSFGIHDYSNGYISLQYQKTNNLYTITNYDYKKKQNNEVSFAGFNFTELEPFVYNKFSYQARYYQFRKATNLDSAKICYLEAFKFLETPIAWT